MLFNPTSGELIAVQDQNEANAYSNMGFVPLPPEAIDQVNSTYQGVKKITLSERSPLLNILRIVVKVAEQVVELEEKKPSRRRSR